MSSFLLNFILVFQNFYKLLIKFFLQRNIYLDYKQAYK